MQETIEGEERARLRFVLQRLQVAVQDLDGRLSRYARDIQQEKTYLWESRADMDHVEKIFTRQTIEQSVMTGDAALAHRQRLARLVVRPYFGRIDFVRDGGNTADQIYIGVHHFDDGDEATALIHDWRAPVSTTFYDYETGPAAYESPGGVVTGRVVLKRQFQIRNGEIELMLDSAVNVMDDLLQRELSRSSDDRMKQIVATIQRDQNAIIRNSEAPVLVIHGVAGSGKTSIALHRIAFLLYRFKETLLSKDILIISPNAVFSDYISNVLPELGEEAVDQIGMDALAGEILGPKVRFQTAVEQAAQLQTSDDEQLQRRIAFKASVEFLRQLDEYADHVERSTSAAEDTWIGRSLVPAWFIEERFRRHRGIAPASRFNAVARDVEHGIGVHYNHELDTIERAELRAAIRRMYRGSTLRAAYKNFYAWAGGPGSL